MLKSLNTNTLFIMNNSTITIIGLTLDIIGAFYLAKGLFISKKAALNLGKSRWVSEKDKDNLKLPQVKDRLKQRNNGIIGFILLFIGFLLQIIGQLTI